MSRAMSMSLYFSSLPLFSPHAADFLLLVARADLYLCPPLVFVFQPLLSFLRPSKQRRRVQRLLLLFSSRLSNAVTDAVPVCKLHCECKKEKEWEDGEEGERGMGRVSLCGRMREYTVEKCASRRRTICGVISGCEGIVNARGTKRNCFWGYGSAEKYGFTARRMRISLTNVSEVAEREDAGSSLYSFFIALVNHGSSFRILSNRRFLKFLIHRIFENPNQGSNNLHYYPCRETRKETRARLICKKEEKRKEEINFLVRLALRELAHQLPADVFRIYTANQYKSYRKNFSTVGQIPSIRGIVVYTRTHKFSICIYIFSIHTEENRSSKQTVAFWKGRGMVEKGGIAARIAESKRCAPPILPLPPLYVWGFAARKNCGQIEGLCAQRVWRRVVVRDMARSRGSIPRAVWLWGQTAVGLNPRGNREDFSARAWKTMGNSIDLRISLNIQRSKFLYRFISLKIKNLFISSIRWWKFYFYLDFLRPKMMILKGYRANCTKSPWILIFPEMRLKFISIIRKV